MTLDRTIEGAPASTREALFRLLKMEGPMTAAALAERLGRSAMAVRQHLYEAERDGAVTHAEEQRPVGRPVKLWRLTPSAHHFFPDSHAELAVGLLAAMRETFGPQGFDKLLECRTEAQRAAYMARMPKRGSLLTRLRALARIRSEEGYMADVIEEGRGTYLLIENHCPICAAAKVCQGLCAAELALFRAVLGEDAEIERRDHVLLGARRCAYRIRAKARARPVSRR